MDETATAEQEQTASDTLDALYEELPGAYGVFLNGVDEVDDSIFLPLSYLLAAEVAPEFSVTSPETTARALVRLRATTNPNDYTGDDEPLYEGYV